MTTKRQWTYSEFLNEVADREYALAGDTLGAFHYVVWTWRDASRQGHVPAERVFEVVLDYLSRRDTITRRIEEGSWRGRAMGRD